MIEQCRCCGCKIPRRRNMGSRGLVIFKIIILKLFYLGQIFRFTQYLIKVNYRLKKLTRSFEIRLY